MFYLSFYTLLADPGQMLLCLYAPLYIKMDAKWAN